MPVELPREAVTATHWIGVRKILDGIQADATPSRAAADSPAGRITRLLRGLAYIPDPRAGWIPFAVREGSRLVRESRPDVIVASSGPASSLIVASLLSKRFKVPWVGDLRDLWVDNHDYPFPDWRRPFDRMLERRVLRSAAGLVTVSQPLASQLERFGRPVAVVLNGYDDADYVTDAPAPVPSRILRIVYTGTIYRQQSPAPLFDAIRGLGKLASRVRMVFFGSPANALMPAAVAAGVDHLLEIRSSVPRVDALREQAAADVLLHLLWNDTSQPGVYGAKIFEYLRAGRPILAVGSTANVAAQLVIDRRAGLATGDVSRITSQLRDWIAAIDAGSGIPPITAEARKGFSRLEQTRVLERFLQAMVSRARGGEHLPALRPND